MNKNHYYLKAYGSNDIILDIVKDKDSLKFYKIKTKYICDIPIRDFLKAMNGIGAILSPNQKYFTIRQIINTNKCVFIFRRSHIKNVIYFCLADSSLARGMITRCTKIIGEYVDVIELIKMLVQFDILKLTEGNNITTYDEIAIGTRNDLNMLRSKFNYDLEYNIDDIDDLYFHEDKYFINK